MKADFIKDKKFESRGEVDRLSVRVTMHITARSKTSQKDLMKIWDSLRNDSSLPTMLELMDSMNKKKG